MFASATDTFRERRTAASRQSPVSCGCPICPCVRAAAGPPDSRPGSSGRSRVELLLIVVVIGAVVFLVSKSQKNKTAGHSANQLEDAKADARQSIERLGGQVYNLTGT